MGKKADRRQKRLQAALEREANTPWALEAAARQQRLESYEWYQTACRAREPIIHMDVPEPAPQSALRAQMEGRTPELLWDTATSQAETRLTEYLDTAAEELGIPAPPFFRPRPGRNLMRILPLFIGFSLAGGRPPEE